MRTNRKLSARLTITRAFSSALANARVESVKAKVRRYQKTEKGRAAKARYERSRPKANLARSKRYYENAGRFQAWLMRQLMTIVRAEEARGRFE